MKKKLYEKPSMEVLECEKGLQLLASSPADVSATMDGTFTEEDLDE